NAAEYVTEVAAHAQGSAEITSPAHNPIRVSVLDRFKFVVASREFTVNRSARSAQFPFDGPLDSAHPPFAHEYTRSPRQSGHDFASLPRAGYWSHVAQEENLEQSQISRRHGIPGFSRDGMPRDARPDDNSIQAKFRAGIAYWHGLDPSGSGRNDSVAECEGNTG